MALGVPAKREGLLARLARGAWGGPLRRKDRATRGAIELDSGSGDDECSIDALLGSNVARRRALHELLRA